MTIETPDRQQAIAFAAARLALAQTSGVPCAPVADLLGKEDIALAYAVQKQNIDREIAAGAVLVGRKIGLTSRAVQAQIGVDRPDFGALLDSMAYADGDEVPHGRLLQPKAEAEIAFTLKQDILDAKDMSAVRAAVDLAFPALEIVDSRIANWKIGITDTVADNASSGVFVIGGQGRSLAEFEPVDAVMEMTRNGETVSQGCGKDCLDDPLNALAWLAQVAIDTGHPLRAGEIILSGALGPMVTIQPGDEFSAKIAPLGEVTLRFASEGRA